jgi:hypothetical protein
MFSEQSVEEIWSRLALFQSRDVLERRYNARHGGKLSAGKADEIIAHLQQARQYFQSAESAGVLAGPLEQYYGVLAFARAIVRRDSNSRPPDRRLTASRTRQDVVLDSFGDRSHHVSGSLLQCDEPKYRQPCNGNGSGAHFVLRHNADRDYFHVVPLVIPSADTTGVGMGVTIACD